MSSRLPIGVGTIYNFDIKWMRVFYLVLDKNKKAFRYLGVFYRDLGNSDLSKGIFSQ
jgi:hypothetical protein